jgi:hypothetical protein
MLFSSGSQQRYKVWRSVSIIATHREYITTTTPEGKVKEGNDEEDEEATPSLTPEEQAALKAKKEALKAKKKEERKERNQRKKEFRAQQIQHRKDLLNKKIEKQELKRMEKQKHADQIVADPELASGGGGVKKKVRRMAKEDLFAGLEESFMTNYDPSNHRPPNSLKNKKRSSNIKQEEEEEEE